MHVIDEWYFFTMFIYLSWQVVREIEVCEQIGVSVGTCEEERDRDPRVCL